MGQGRNAIWLAQQGWTVTGFDPAEKAVALAAQNAAALNVKLRSEIKTFDEFDFGDQQWDLILLSYVGARGRSIGGAVVFDTGEIPSLFPLLRVVRYEEPMARSDFGMEVVRLVRYCAERPVLEAVH